MNEMETIRTALERGLEVLRAYKPCRCKHCEEDRQGFIAALSAVAALQKERESRSWLIHFEDASMRPEVFMGPDPEYWARVRIAALSENWNVTLFRSADAAIGEPAAPQDALHEAGKRYGDFADEKLGAEPK